MPASRCSIRRSWARATSSSVASFGSIPSMSSVRLIVSTISVSIPTCPARRSSHRSAKLRISNPVRLGSYAMPVTSLPGNAVRVLGVVKRVAKSRKQVLLDVRQPVEVHGLEPSCIPHQADHPVRERHQVPSRIAPLVEEGHEGGEELLVVRDHLSILDRDVVLFLESLERRPVSASSPIDVERPLRNRELPSLRRQGRAWSNRFVRAACGEQRRERSRPERASARAPKNLPPRERPFYPAAQVTIDHPRHPP